MKRVVVTGSSGFIGTAMATFLKQQGYEVLSLRRESFYQPETFLPSDKAVLAALGEFSPDTIFHFAGTSHTAHVSELYEANLLTTVALLTALRKLESFPLLVICGSAAEYGFPPPDRLPISEKQAEAPVDEYGASKLAQTHLARIYSSRGFPIIITRPFNLLGTRMPTRLAFGSFLQQIKAARHSGGCTLRVGNLATYRDFVLIDDAVRAWVNLAESPSAIGRTVNICSGQPTGLQSLIDWLIESVPLPVEVVQDHTRARRLDAERHFGDNSLLKSIVGWAPNPPSRSDIARIVQDDSTLA